MKNFNMPDFVSPTLEQEEMERLKKSLTKHISKKDAEEFLALIPLAVNAGADQRGLWLKTCAELWKITLIKRKSSRYAKTVTAMKMADSRRQQNL